jgi:hypothetical protein
MRQINYDILLLIQGNAVFRVDLATSFPILTDHIDSFITNPNCSCKNTILKHLWDNRDSFAFHELETRWADTLTFIVDIPDVTPVSINKREMFGEVEVIPSTREAYRNLIKRAKKEQWIFHGFTVTETKRKWKVFFY